MTHLQIAIIVALYVSGWIFTSWMHCKYSGHTLLGEVGATLLLHLVLWPFAAPAFLMSAFMRGKF